MKRVVLSILFASVMLLFSARAYAGKYNITGLKYGDGSGTSEHCWVLAEVTGYDVNANVYGTMNDLRSRQNQVGKENAEREKANKAVTDEIRKLNGQIAVKGRELAKAADESAKSDLQKTIDDLKSQVNAKKSELKTLVRLPDAVSFNKRADADKYIEQLYKDSEAAKAKAAEKEAAAAAKKGT